MGNWLCVYHLEKALAGALALVHTYIQRETEIKKKIVGILAL